MKGLKQSTVATVIVGPVLDSTGAAVTNAVVGDFRLAKNGTVATLSGATVTHDANGYYLIALTTGNTDTTGRLVLTSGNTAHSMASHHWSVLPASVFDAIYTNATNSTGGLATATGTITALAGAVSTLTASGVRTELATELGRIDATIASRATQTSVDAIDDFIDTEVAAIKAKTDLIVTFPVNFGNLDITAGGGIAELGPNALATNDLYSPIADAVWDEVLTGATHNIASSAGRRLRQLASVIVRAGTAQGPGTGNNQIQLDAGASATNGEYDPGLIFIETGTGAGQARLILQYNGSTKVATVDRDWRINPDNTSEFVILADAGRNSVNEGLAQGGTSTTITLNASASASDDAYNGQLVFIRSGTGQDQVGLVEDYVGSTKVATIRTRSATGQWATVPDTTSAYMMIPNLTFTLSEISGAVADGVWDEATSGHTTAGTTGKALIDSGAAGNPWSTDLATGYSGTQAGNILNNVKSQTDLIQAGGTVTVSTPVTESGQLASPLIIGDDYLNSNGRAFSWTVALPSGFVAATATCKFGMRYEDDQGVNSFVQSGTVIDAGSGNVTLRFDVAKAVTGLLRPGWYDWSVEIASASGTEITRVKSGKNAEWQEKQT
jgi:hypothetical protein